MTSISATPLRCSDCDTTDGPFADLAKAVHPYVFEHVGWLCERCLVALGFTPPVLTHPDLTATVE